MKLFNNINVVKIFVYLYLALFIFLFCYTFYRAEFFYNGNQFAYYYKYYLIFMISIFFWFLVLFLNKELRSKIVFLFTIVIFLLYFYETLSFYGLSIKSHFATTIEVDNSKLDLIKKLKNEKKVDVVPSVFPKLLLDKKFVKKENDIFPLGGVSNSVTVFCKEGEEFSVYNSDRYGFNNPDLEWDSKEVYWYLIGDSFTQGSCVLPGEDFASQIRILTKQNAISLGMSGNGPLIELASLKEYAFEKKPKIVLWFYFERNDLEELKNEKSNLIFLNYLQKGFSQNLISKQTEIDIILKKFIEEGKKELKTNKINKNEKLEKFLSLKKIIRLQIIRDKLALDRGIIFDIDPLFKKIIFEANTTVSKWGGKLYFIYLPDKERYSSNNAKNDNYLKRSEVIKLINNMNIPIIDIHKEFFMKKNDPISFFAHRIYGHYSAEGYHDISKFIIEKIQEINHYQ